MKNITTTGLILLIVLAVFYSCLSTSCKSENTHAATSENLQGYDKSIPQLLIRNKILSENAEWDKTVTVVGKINQKLEQNPKDLKSLIQLSQIYFNEARITGEHGYYYPAILNILNRVPSGEINDDNIKFHALSLKSAVLLSLHEFQKAKEIASEAVKLNPHNAQVYGALVDANVELGNYTEAVKMAEKMMDLRPDLLAYSRASYLREIHGDIDGAIEAMMLAVSSGVPGSENTEWARLTLGRIYEDYGQLDKAMEQYETALNERPNYAFAIAGIARIKNKNGNAAEAITLLENAAAIIPEVGFYHEMAVIYKETGKHKEAMALTDTILNMLADDEAQGHKMTLEYAQLHLEITGDYGKALEKAKEEHKIRPYNIDVNKLLAEIYFKIGDLENSNKYLSAAKRTGSKAPSLVVLTDLLAIK